MEVGTGLVPGFGSNLQTEQVMNYIYFSALVETAVCGAEFSTSLVGVDARGHVYLVEPLGGFEDDPNVTNKRFAGSITQSYDGLLLQATRAGGRWVRGRLRSDLAHCVIESAFANAATCWSAKFWEMLVCGNTASKTWKAPGTVTSSQATLAALSRAA